MKSYHGYVGPEENYPGKRGLFGRNTEYRAYKQAAAVMNEVRDNAFRCIRHLRGQEYSQGAFSKVWDDVVNMLGTVHVYQNNALCLGANEARWTYAPGWDANVKVCELDGPEAYHLIREGLGFSNYEGDRQAVKKEYFNKNFLPRLERLCAAIALSNRVEPDRGFFIHMPYTLPDGDKLDYDKMIDFVLKDETPPLNVVREMEKHGLMKKVDVTVLKNYSGYVGPEENWPGKRSRRDPEYLAYKKAAKACDAVRNAAVDCIGHLREAKYSAGAFSRDWDMVVHALGLKDVFPDNNLSFLARQARWTFAPGWDRGVNVSELDGPEGKCLINDGLGFQYEGPDAAVKRQYYNEVFKPVMIKRLTAIAVANTVSREKGFSFDEKINETAGVEFDFDKVYDYMLTGPKADLNVTELRAMEKGAKSFFDKLTVNSDRDMKISLR